MFTSGHLNSECLPFLVLTIRLDVLHGLNEDRALGICISVILTKDQ